MLGLASVDAYGGAPGSDWPVVQESDLARRLWSMLAVAAKHLVPGRCDTLLICGLQDVAAAVAA